MGLVDAVESTVGIPGGGALAQIREDQRQANTGDDKFLKKEFYFFELEIPESVKVNNSTKFLFPLMLNPENYDLEEPFTMNATPTQGGGLFVEENGIVQRTIKISGTTGFRPRKLPVTSTAPLNARTPDTRSHARNLDPFMLDAVSGHRHFQYLQDAVFRTYADLKRDPATSKDTKLFFHIAKDDEHWQVAPVRFSLNRSKDAPVTYRYNIELLVVGPAKPAGFTFSEDKSLLDQITDVIRDVKGAIDMVNGALSDIKAIAGAIEGLVKDIATIIDTVSDVLANAADFVSGVKDFIENPFAVLDSISDALDRAGESWEQLEASFQDQPALPATVKQNLRNIADGMDRLALHPSAFETPSQKKLRENRERQELITSAGSAAIATALASTTPATLDEVESLGTTITPGEAEAAAGAYTVGRNANSYASTLEVAVGQGDTLINLAARYLGDARLWQDIAIINGVKPPFVDELATLPLDSGTDETPLPGALGKGGKILIPSFSPPPQSQPELPVLGVTQAESPEVHLLGRDLLAQVDPNSRVGDPQFDLVIDTDRGSTDIKAVAGIANIGQALQTRVRVERGTDPMYKSLGMDRVIGLNQIDLDLATFRFRMSQALADDPRIARVRRILLDNDESADAVVADVDVELRGFAESSNIRVAI